MKVQKIKLNSYDVTWIVLDDNHLPIKPITEFVRYLNNVDKSPCTVKSYAYCLKLFWDYLADKELNWKTINLGSLAGFVGWLRQSKEPAQIIDLQAARKPATINVILGCLSSFYRFHNQLGNTDVKVTETVNLPNNRYKALLHHVYKNKPAQRRIVSVKQVKQPPKTITKDQFIQLRSACTNYRDQFLVCILYETGIRIGQALALRHEDIICWNNEIHIRYRFNNLNGVRNKTITPNIVQVSNELMELYSDYVSTLDQNKLTEYVFINLITYKALNYSAAKKLFMTLSRKCNLYVRPHMLRHSHASDLLKSGWEMSLIQKRLGHASIQTTIDIYTHIDTKQMKQAFHQFISNKEKN
jgi:integrase